MMMMQEGKEEKIRNKYSIAAEIVEEANEDSVDSDTPNQQPPTHNK